jgi:hypothetical protein
VCVISCRVQAVLKHPLGLGKKQRLGRKAAVLKRKIYISDIPDRGKMNHVCLPHRAIEPIGTIQAGQEIRELLFFNLY